MNSRVTAAVLMGPRRFEIKEFERPRLKEGDLLMKVVYCGICASDIHLWRGDWDPPYPFIPGHEFVGEVEEGGGVGETKGVEVGDQVAVEMILPCFSCEGCLRGDYNLCLRDDRSLSPQHGVQYGCNIPITRPPTPLWGGYSQYLYVPQGALVHKFSRRVDWREGAAVEPLAVSLRAIKISGIREGESLVVIGPGMIGLMAVVAGRMVGAQPIILTGTRPFRLKVGEELGADHTLNIRENPDPVGEVKRLTGGTGPDVVLEAAGTPSGQTQALTIARKKGRVVFTGLLGGEELRIRPDTDLVMKELTLKASYLSAHAYQEAVKIIESGRFPLQKVFTHSFALKEVDKAFDVVLQRRDEVIKALLDPWR